MHQLMSGAATNDPWAGSPTAIQNQFSEFQMSEPRQVEGRGCWRCLCCCARGGRKYQRGRSTRVSGLEENMCLMECDELNLVWETERSKDIT